MALEWFRCQQAQFPVNTRHLQNGVTACSKGQRKKSVQPPFHRFPLNSNQDPQLHASSMTEQIIQDVFQTCDPRTSVQTCSWSVWPQRHVEMKPGWKEEQISASDICYPFAFMCNSRACDHCHKGWLFPGYSRQWCHEPPFNAACKSTFILTSCCSYCLGSFVSWQSK